MPCMSNIIAGHAQQPLRLSQRIQYRYPLFSQLVDRIGVMGRITVGVRVSMGSIKYGDRTLIRRVRGRQRGRVVKAMDC